MDLCSAETYYNPRPMCSTFCRPRVKRTARQSNCSTETEGREKTTKKDENSVFVVRRNLLKALQKHLKKFRGAGKLQIFALSGGKEVVTVGLNSLKLCVLYI